MGNVGRKKLYVAFDTSPDGLKQIEEIKKKIKVSMVIRLKRDKLEIDLRGSKADVKDALFKIKEILRS